MSRDPRSPDATPAEVAAVRTGSANDAYSPNDRERLYRRSLTVVVVSQVFGGAGLAAGVTVGALLAQDMLGSDSLTGVPVALFTFGSAGAALLIGRLSQRAGRRAGLTAGFVAGGVGAAGVVAAAVLGSAALLFAAFLVYGAGTATNLQARYAGTDLAAANRRATAVSIAMVSTTLGAVAGPNLVAPMGRLAQSWGIPPLAGPFLLAAAAYLAAGAVLWIWLRPDPLLVARSLDAAIATDPAGAGATATDERDSDHRGVVVGATVMVLTQIAMVAIMTMTPLHMQHHGFGLAAIGVVIGVHIGAMYLPSLVTGVLVDRVGRLPMAIAAGLTLLAAGVVAALAPADSMTTLLIALALLGLGWNFGLISGTALIVDSTPPVTRAKTQGSVDLLIALAGAGGGAVSGMVVAASSYSVLALGGGILSLLLVPVVLWSRRS